MIDWSNCPAIERDAGRVSGAWLFRSTRVPVAALLENLEDGASVAQFLEWFPSGDCRLENDLRFLDRLAEARAGLRAGPGVRLEEIDPR